MASQQINEVELEEQLAGVSDEERVPSAMGVRARTGLLALVAMLATAGFAAMTLGGRSTAAKSALMKTDTLKAYNDQPTYDLVPARGDAFHATPVVPLHFQPPAQVVTNRFQQPPACKYSVGDPVYVQGANGGWHHATVNEVQSGCNYRVQYTDGTQQMYATSQTHQNNWWSYNWWWVTLLIFIALLAAIFVAIKK
mmetsp:Transcript_109655/g.317067  ORF Transcript_109655/g.317067 Transcript_109655/m.317067 type:complete len:196 (-) Transcript_109655:95-682(-)